MCHMRRRIHVSCMCAQHQMLQASLSQTPNPKPQTPNPKPQTLNPKPRVVTGLWGSDRQFSWRSCSISADAQMWKEKRTLYNPFEIRRNGSSVVALTSSASKKNKLIAVPQFLSSRRRVAQENKSPCSVCTKCMMFETRRI